MRSYSKFVFAVLAGVSIVINQNCSKVSFVSISELIAVQKLAFFDPQSSVTGVAGANGMPTENLRLSSVSEAMKDMVKDCSGPVTLADGKTQDRYSWERERALEKAEADPDHKTIPVEFAISFGDKEDRLAYWAHQRAILSESNPGYTIIPVGGKSRPSQSNGMAGYYVTDHNDAKNNYINGERCFFDTVTVTDFKELGGYYDFIRSVETDNGLIHKIHYMMYGWCAGADRCADATSSYGAGNYGRDAYPNRLFATLDQEGPDGRPQIVKAYIADLRGGHFGVAGNPIIQVKEGTARGAEVQLDLLKQMDLRTLFRQSGSVIRNLSFEYKSPESGESFAGMSGIPQLIHNLLLEGVEGTILASQYTPIVLDLGKPQIRTSDTFGGTLFNMSATKNPESTGPDDEFDILEITSWIGGELVDVQADAEKEDGLKFPMDVRRVADDGFLTLPDADGKIRSSRNLFGDKIEIDGRAYANGFLALQAYAKKDCKSSEIKDRYLGPWDIAYQVLKVWVDANRNGKNEDSEMKSLEESGVAALNTCNVLSSEEKDQFGNGSAMRSAFLFSPNESLSETEILHRISTGETSSSETAEFRVAIDLIFQTKRPVDTEQIEAPRRFRE